jgi:hypothetical protein
MVEVDPTTKLIGADGPVPLIDIFDGCSQLIAYFHIWHTGRPDRSWPSFEWRLWWWFHSLFVAVWCPPCHKKPCKYWIGRLAQR